MVDRRERISKESVLFDNEQLGIKVVQKASQIVVIDLDGVHNEVLLSSRDADVLLFLLDNVDFDQVAKPRYDNTKRVLQGEQTSRSGRVIDLDKSTIEPLFFKITFLNERIRVAKVRQWYEVSAYLPWRGDRRKRTFSNQ